MKLMKWMAKAIIQVVIMVMISGITTIYAVQLYVDELVRGTPLAGQLKRVDPLLLIGQWGEQAYGYLNGEKEDGKSVRVSSVPSESSRNADKQPAPAKSDTGSDKATVEPKKPVGDDAVAVWSQTSSSSTSGSGNYGSGSSDAADKGNKVVMSSEEFAKKKDALSSEDKMKLFSLLASSLPQDEMQQMSKIAEDGVTASEMRELERIVSAYLSPDQYSQLTEILNKY
jgi:hypothetical protein